VAPNKSLAKGLAVLETLASSPRPLTAAQLSQQLKYPRPTLYRILDTLLFHDFVMREGDGAFYRLSFKVLDLGHQLLERTDLLGAARPVLQRLEAEFRETVHLAVHQDGRMVYLDKCEGSGPFCTHSRPGSRVPMHCTALGKAILAFLPTPRTRAILRTHGMPRYTARTTVSGAAMERELSTIRRLGYALDDVEFEPDVRCVGAPILDHRGQPVAAISVSAPASRMSLSRARLVGSALRLAVLQVSQAMGWRPGSRAAVSESPARGAAVRAAAAAGGGGAEVRGPRPSTR
jgi:IclR family transcriptional regulator, KDG regulon repressor